MIEKQLWHPVVAGMHLRSEPVAVDLLGVSLVLWREAAHEHGAGHDSVVHAWADRCPHRGAKLSLGRVLNHLHGSRLECPYHGWQFAGDVAGRATPGEALPVGRCLHVPAAPNFEPPASHCALVYEALERHGLVWVRLERPDRTQVPAALAEPPVFEPWSDPLWRQLVCGPYAVATSAPRLVENFLDLSHFGFVHEGWLGARSHAQVDTGQVQEGASGVVALGCKAWQPKGYAGAESSGWVAYRYQVPHPFAAILRKDASDGDPVSNAIALFIRPDGAEACTAWFAIATLGDLSDDEELRAFQDTVFAQDRPIVESQTPKTLPLGNSGGIGDSGAVSEVHGPADRLSSAYRRYLARLGVSLGVC